VYCWVSASSTDLPIVDIPTPFNALFRQGAELSLLLLSIAAHILIAIRRQAAKAFPQWQPSLPDLVHEHSSISTQVKRRHFLF
jgi:hypothetical protein